MTVERGCLILIWQGDAVGAALHDAVLNAAVMTQRTGDEPGYDDQQSGNNQKRSHRWPIIVIVGSIVVLVVVVLDWAVIHP